MNVYNLFAVSADSDDRPSVDAYKLSTVRLKLEEKRRQIEQDKRKIEANLNRHQQKVGKAAFLQAINKVCKQLFHISFTVRTVFASLEEYFVIFFISKFHDIRYRNLLRQM